MKTNYHIAISAMLFALGMIFSSFCPPLVFGLRPDFMLITLFIMVFNIRDFKICIAASITAGLLVASTTQYPGGQIPNIIDKFVVGLVAYICFPYLNSKKGYIFGIFVAAASLLSGLIFLLCFKIFFELPSGLLQMVLGIMLPLAIINGIIFIPVYKLSKKFF